MKEIDTKATGSPNVSPCQPSLPKEDEAFYHELGWLPSEPRSEKVSVGFKAESVDDPVLDSGIDSVPYCEQRLFMSVVRVTVPGGGSVFSRLEELAYDVGNVLGGRDIGTHNEEERPTPYRDRVDVESSLGYTGMARFLGNQAGFTLRYSVTDNCVSIEAVMPKSGRPEVLVLQRREWNELSARLSEVCSGYVIAPMSEDKRQLDLLDEPFDLPPLAAMPPAAEYASRADLEKMERVIRFDGEHILYVEHFSPEFSEGTSDGLDLPAYLCDSFKLDEIDVGRIKGSPHEEKVDLLKKIAEVRLNEKYMG